MLGLPEERLEPLILGAGLGDRELDSPEPIPSGRILRFHLGRLIRRNNYRELGPKLE